MKAVKLKPLNDVESSVVYTGREIERDHKDAHKGKQLKLCCYQDPKISPNKTKTGLNFGEKDGKKQYTPEIYHFARGKVYLPKKESGSSRPFASTFCEGPKKTFNYGG